MSKIALAGFGMEGRATYDYLKGTAELHVFDETDVDVAGVDAVFHKGLIIPADFDVVYKTPGIPTRKLVLESSNTKITTLMDDVLARVGPRSIGITGTKGKSTIASLVYHILTGAGKDSVLFGNIGVADMSTVESSPGKTFVLELSSYQLEHCTHSPHVAVLINLYPEHLSHHGSLEKYREAKLNIARFQGPDDIFINGSDLKPDFKGYLHVPTLGTSFKTTLLGAHNQYNCLLAVATAEAFGVSEKDARKHIATFQPLEYRLENVGEYNGITFYDDSLATIPQATMASIEALKKVDTIILGGQDRDIPFGDFAKDLANTKIQTFITFPDTGDKMITAVRGRTIVPVRSMEDAVRAAYAYTPAGGTVLLSNASPSFNLFKNYKDKSAQYRTWIKKLV